MSKQFLKPGTMLNPVPVVMVSCGDFSSKSMNIITVAWTGTVCSDPPMLSVSIRPERYSHEIIEKTREFVVNLTTKDLCFATDYCGVKSGRDMDKFDAAKLTPVESKTVKAPSIAESPVNLECSVKDILRLGSHDVYIAQITAVAAESSYFDSQGKFDLSLADPICYSHGFYYTLGDCLGKFGYSVQKNK